MSRATKRWVAEVTGGLFLGLCACVLLALAVAR